MPTYAQLNTEAVWRGETVTPHMEWLVTNLCAFYGVPRANGGIKGDNKHLNGGHRSQSWIRNSRYCTNRTYTVVPGLAPHLADDVPAFDVTLPRWAMLQISSNADKLTRSGQLEELVLWYGNTDGDQRVDGYDNIRNAVVTSDASHLWHLHGQVSRHLTRSWEAVRKIYRGLTTGRVDMGQADDRAPYIDQRLYQISHGQVKVDGNPAFANVAPNEENWLVKTVKAQGEQLERIEQNQATIEGHLRALLDRPVAGGATDEQVRQAVRDQIDDDPTT